MSSQVNERSVASLYCRHRIKPAAGNKLGDSARYRSDVPAFGCCACSQRESVDIPQALITNMLRFNLRYLSARGLTTPRKGDDEWKRHQDNQIINIMRKGTYTTILIYELLYYCCFKCINQHFFGELYETSHNRTLFKNYKKLRKNVRVQNK